MLKFGNKEFRNIQEQVEKNAKDIEKLIEDGVSGGLPSDNPTADGQILVGNTDGSVDWTTETISELVNESEFEELVRATPTSVSIIEDQGKLELMLEHDGNVLDINETPNIFLQKKLVSGTNIKTINGVSILGSGDLQIGEGGIVSDDNVVEFEEISAAPIAPTVVDEATMTKLQDPNTIIKYNNRNYYYTSWIGGDAQTVEYRNVVTIVRNPATGNASIFYNTINVRVVSTGTYTPAGVWFAADDQVFDIPSTLGTDYTDDGAYIWVANKYGTTKTSAWQKYTPGSGGSVDLSNYYTKQESEDQFASKSSFNTTVMGINAVLDDIPNTYATRVSVAGLEATVMGEISSLDSRVETLEDVAAGEGNFVPLDPVTEDGQILVGNIDGTYTWSTQTITELYNTASTANTTANEAKSITVGFSENLSNLRISLDSTDEDVADLNTRVTALENLGNAEEGSY